MSSKTKIVVFQMKELIYTGIFVALGVVLILLFIFMFLPKDKGSPDITDTASKYVAGVYTSSIAINNQALDVEVIVDKDHINSIRLVNQNETVSAMYPLFEPTLENLSRQLLSTQSVDKLTYTEESRYTSQVLIEAIRMALDKAKASSDQK